MIIRLETTINTGLKYYIVLASFSETILIEYEQYPSNKNNIY